MKVSKITLTDSGFCVHPDDNLTLKTMVKMVTAVYLLVSVVAYSLGEKAQETGPVASGIFDSCWKKLNKPMTHWDIEED